MFRSAERFCLKGHCERSSSLQHLSMTMGAVFFVSHSHSGATGTIYSGTPHRYSVSYITAAEACGTVFDRQEMHL